MTPEEFRAAGHALVEWIAGYREGLSELPVAATTQPGEVRNALPTTPPSHTDGISALLADLDAIVVPGLTQVQHPRSFAWFPANASLASVLGDMASSGLGALGISWQSAPALTELEEVMCDWMRQLVGLSDAWRGVIQDTASTACLVAMLAARERALGSGRSGGGLQAAERPLTVYYSAQAHSSVAKAALLAGIGADHLREIDVDPDTYAMRVDSLQETIERDVARGSQPTAIVATVGSTATTAVDPVQGIVSVAAAHGAWVHVDAAQAGSAMLLEDLRRLWAGVEGADSVSWNPHKWMGTVLDTSLFYVRDVAHLVGVMSTNPSYLRSARDSEVTQYRDWGIPLGRRFRALKLWFHLRLDGVEAIRDRLRRDLDNAQWLRHEVERRPGWRVLAPVPLQTVCVRHDPGGLDAASLDRHTLDWVEAINRSGQALLTPALLADRWMARVSIGTERCERADVSALWGLMRAAAEAA